MRNIGIVWKRTTKRSGTRFGRIQKRKNLRVVVRVAVEPFTY